MRDNATCSGCPKPVVFCDGTVPRFESLRVELKSQMSSEKITFLIRAIHDALQSSEQLDGVQQTISRLAALDLDGHRCSPLPPQIPLHFESKLKAAVDHIPTSLKTVAEALSAAAPYLNWNAETDSSAGYYEAGADVGQSFLDGNLVCRLVGPSESFFFSQDLFLSLFFLKPRTLIEITLIRLPRCISTSRAPAVFGWVMRAGLIIPPTR